MERLTYRSPKFNNPVSNGACKDITCSAECDSCKINDLIAKLCAYEDTGLEPEEIADFMKRWEQTVEIGGMLKKYGIDHIWDIIQAEQDGRLVVLDEKTALCMCAGARAIENNKRLFGASYCYDVFGKRGGPKEISYYEASNHLRDVAEPVLDREEAEAALALKGGEGL